MYEIQQVETILYAVQQAPKAAGCKIVQNEVQNRTNSDRSEGGKSYRQGRTPPPHARPRHGVKCSPSPENLPILVVLWCVWGCVSACVCLNERDLRTFCPPSTRFRPTS